MPKSEPLFRREKCDPRDDFWHTLKIGIPIGLGLVFLSFLFILFERVTQ
jgi:Na+-driven multidrug efflux pump